MNIILIILFASSLALLVIVSYKLITNFLILKKEDDFLTLLEKREKDCVIHTYKTHSGLLILDDDIFQAYKTGNKVIPIQKQGFKSEMPYDTITEY
jgi:hypothetical protein